MENLKDALEYAVSLAEGAPEIFTIEGRPYSTHKLNLIEEPKEPDAPFPSTLNVRTLRGLIDYITENREDIDFYGTMLMISGHDAAKLITTPNAKAVRSSIIEAKADVPAVGFGDFMETDKFIVYLLSLFQPTEDRERIIRYISHITDENVTSVSDDGVSQKVIVKAGIKGLAEVELPNPVKLAPYRTFPELNQPVSEYIFRLDEKGCCALFEADGGNWRNHCREIIKKCLRDSLSGIPGIVVIG